LLKQPKAIGIVVGVGEFRESAIPRVKYAARDAEAMATYFKFIGGIPPERVRTLVDSQALKHDLTEVLEEWLPEHVDSTTVVYISITGRGVVEPITGAVSIIPFDGMATSRARLYSLGNIADSASHCDDGPFTGTGAWHGVQGHERSDVETRRQGEREDHVDDRESGSPGNTYI
jgi:hypothetical protein